MTLKLHRLPAWMLLAAAWAAAGCEHAIPLPPTNLAAYERMRRRNPPDYPDYTVRQYNLRRVCDASLGEAERADSLELLVRLAGHDPAVAEHLAAVLADPSSPTRLHHAALEYLLRKDDAKIAVYAVAALGNANLPPALRDAILQWLTRHPRPQVLSQVVKLWAEQPAGGPDEATYRRIVTSISGKPWDEALLLGLNTEQFFARGSAVELLASRLEAGEFRRRLLSLAPATDAVRAAQTFIRRFDYVPSRGAALLTAAWLYTTRRRMLDDAAALWRKWQRRSAEPFRVRDFHLLSRLARDPLREDRPRSELIVELTRQLASRQHVRRGAAGADDFASHVDALTTGDLWTLYLLDEMLRRRRVRLALRLMAERDRADVYHAWGGLVFYENGQAEAKLYEFDPKQPSDDLRYVASEYVEADGRDAMCRFHAHFEKAANAARAGPTKEELRAAAEGGYRGLVLTTLSEASFAAHYYTPEGVVVSLGVLPLLQQ
jgi:hypothetical protein